MYYIGYILGIVLILWLIITLVKALSGKKDKGSDAGPSSADYPSAGGSAGSEGSGIRTAVPGKGSEGGSMPSGEMPSGPMPSAGPAGYRPKEDAWRETERSETEPAGLSEEIYMKAPSDIDLPKLFGEIIASQGGIVGNAFFRKREDVRTCCTCRQGRT